MRTYWDEIQRWAYLKKARITADLIWNDTHRPVTVDQVRQVIGEPPEGIDPRINGAIFKGWRKVYGVNSRRTRCHHRPICGFLPPMSFIKSAFYLTYFKVVR